MPSINMIAARRTEKHRREQKTRNLIYGILAEAGLFMVALSFMVVQLVTTQGQGGSLNDKIAKLKPQVEQIQNLQEQTALLQPKLVALDAARDNTLYWYTAVQNLTASLSDTCWLVGLTTTGDPSVVTGAVALPGVSAVGATMTMTGESINQTDVGQMMLRMNQYPHFDHLTLSYVQQATGSSPTEGTGVNPVNFQLAVQLHSTAPPAKPDGKTLGNANAQRS
jgi:Tfp pilus assembly protein PilN